VDGETILNGPEEPAVAWVLARLLEQDVFPEGTEAHQIARKWVQHGHDAITPIELTLLARSIEPLMKNARCQVCGQPITFVELPAYLKGSDGRCWRHHLSRHIGNDSFIF